MPAELASMILTTVLAAGSVPTEAPEPEFLEFLGAFETRDGKWLDPAILDDKTEDPPSTARPEDRL